MHELSIEELEGQSLELLPDREAMLVVFVAVKIKIGLFICL